MTRSCRRVFLGLSALIVCLLAPTGAEQPGLDGFIGCRFSKGLCHLYEECINDGLFGRCQRVDDVIDEYRYDVESSDLYILEEEVTRLLTDGYTWNEPYTQCVLGNILLAIRRKENIDPNFCGRSSGRHLWGREEEDARSIREWEQEERNERLEEQVEDDLDEILENYYENQAGDNVVDQARGEVAYNEYPLDGSRVPVDKKDEIVNVHKYFSNEKRSEEDLSREVDEAEAEVLTYFLNRLQANDLENERRYIEKDNDYDEDLAERFVPEAQNEEIVESRPSYYEYDYPEEEEFPAREEEIVQGEDYNDDLILPDDVSEDELPMTPNDAKMLEEILQNNDVMNSLNEDEIKRLLRYVGDLIGNLDQSRSEAGGATDPESMEVLADRDIAGTGPAAIHRAVKKEQMNDDVMDNAVGNSHIRVVSNKRDPSFASKDIVADDNHDHHFDDNMVNTHTKGPQFEVINGNFGYVKVKPILEDFSEASSFLEYLEKSVGLMPGTLSMEGLSNGDITFEVHPNAQNLNANDVANLVLGASEDIRNATNISILSAGIGNDNKVSLDSGNGPKYFVLTFVLCGTIAGIVIGVIALYVIKSHSVSKDKLASLGGNTGPDASNEASKDYQDLCRQRMQGKSSEKPEPLNAVTRIGSVSTNEVRSPSSRSSTSSWSEEPVQSNMDISTGHIILSYMEDHQKNTDRLETEWKALCDYEAEPNATTAANDSANMRRNRYTDIFPYDHSRVVLSKTINVSGSDYINASTITDHDPRTPAYIATQGPLPHTVADFWQMVWEQGSVVIVMLTKLTENGDAMCHRYWPEEGSDLYHIYEVHLVSEHIWCDDYVVRSFYLKNLQTNETRTVTQFHFLTWPDLGIPSTTKTLLDFRRKINKSYRGPSCPILVHCSDGVGRTGTYCLIDMVLSRLSKGAKEIDIAATLEHIRDQRINMVKTKEQFAFALASVAEEVHAILRALPQ